jgi:tungstate transport system ATP-binding protein
MPDGTSPEALARAPCSLLPIETVGLTLRAGDIPLLDGVDMNLTSTGITVVMGPNGAGKSLLLKLLHGLIEPTAGIIRYGGEPLDRSVRSRQAMVFQKPVLLRRSVGANIDFVLAARGERSRALRASLLARVGLADHAARPARLLSGGEQQRLALARALACGPEVLFLDEPTASLDPGSVLRIEQIVLAARAQGVKVVFVTHDLAQARRLADEVVFLHRGRIAEQASAARFFERPSSVPARDFVSGRIVL